MLSHLQSDGYVPVPSELFRVKRNACLKKKNSTKTTSDEQSVKYEMVVCHLWLFLLLSSLIFIQRPWLLFSYCWWCYGICLNSYIQMRENSVFYYYKFVFKPLSCWNCKMLYIFNDQCGCMTDIWHLFLFIGIYFCRLLF